MSPGVDLQPGYHENAELMQQIAELVEQPVEALTSVAELSFLEPFDVDAMMSLQEYYRTIPDAVSYPEDLAAEQVFDLRWTEELLGQSA